MRKKCVLYLLFLLLSPLILSAQTDGRRIALVIGNASYRGMNRLRNPARLTDLEAGSYRLEMRYDDG